MRCYKALLLLPACLITLSATLVHAQPPLRCADILADASEKKLDQVTSLHFQCAVTDQLKDGVPQALVGMADLSSASIRLISYNPGTEVLAWNVPRGPRLTDDSIDECNGQLELLMDNALERRGWFVGADRQELKAKWSIQVDPTPPPPPPSTGCTCCCRRWGLFGFRRWGLFGCRARMYRCWVPIRTCRPAPCCVASSEQPQDKVAAAINAEEEQLPETASVLANANVEFGELRWWHDVEGRTSYCRATLLDVIDGICLFRGEEGELMSCGIDRISEADAKYVDAWSKQVADESKLSFRTFTDVSGKYEAQLALLGVEDGGCVLLHRDGSMVHVPLDQLSSADRAYVAAWHPVERLLADIR